MERLKKTRNYFTAIGYARVNDLTFTIDKINNSNTYKYNKANLKLEFENNNSLYFESFDGYSINTNGDYAGSKIYVNNKDTNEMFNIDFMDRDNEQLLEIISPMNFKKVGIFKNTDNKLDVKNFISDYDMIQYLKDNLEDNTLVKITGILQYNESNGNVYIRQVIKNLYVIDELRGNDKIGCQFNQEIILTHDSINMNDIKKGELNVNGTIIEYCSNSKENKPITKQFAIALDKNKPKEVTAMAMFVKNYLKPPKDVIRSINLKCKIENAVEETKLTEADITDDLKLLIDAGFMSIDDVLKSSSARTTSTSKLYILEPIIIKNAQGKLTIDYDDEKYKDLVFTNVTFEEVPFDDDEEENKKDEAMKQLDIEDLDGLLDGILNN